jgi:hypothetical protein
MFAFLRFGVLFPQVEFTQYFLVFLDIGFLKEIEEPPAFADKGKQASAGMMIFLMKLEMIA